MYLRRKPGRIYTQIIRIVGLRAFLGQQEYVVVINKQTETVVSLLHTKWIVAHTMSDLGTRNSIVYHTCCDSVVQADADRDTAHLHTRPLHSPEQGRQLCSHINIKQRYIFMKCDTFISHYPNASCSQILELT